MAQRVYELFEKRVSLLLVLAALTVASVPATVAFGTVYKPWEVVLGLLEGSSDVAQALVLRFRRALVSLLVGAFLGGAGVLTQAAFRNQLASPFTLGISSASALGVAVALVLGVGGRGGSWFVTFSSPAVLALFAFTFSLAQTLLVLLLAWKAGLDPRALILASISLNFLYQAVLYLVQYLVLNEIQLATVVFWTFGDLGRAGWQELSFLLAGSPVITLAYLLLHKDLDLLLLGDDVAETSGINPRRTRLITVIAAALGAALATSFVGILAFLCLLSPHLARLLIGGRHKYLVPASMLIGALILEWADAISRTILSPVVLPVGVTLSMVGAPLLVYLLLRGGPSGGHKG
ncbi:MAG: iron ABC transporter permease [Thermofilum sp.]|jgi:iron complex transport system permease protein|nr:iron ABC transporter permease [Thermofilum sp.]